MMVYARASNAVVLPLLAGFVAMAWYASRGILSMSLIDAIGFEAYFSLLGISYLVSLAGYLVGGVGAVLATPWASLSVGLFLTATGLAGLGVMDPESATAPFLIATFGRAIASIGLWGALAAALDGRYGKLRDAAFIATYVGTNMGAMVLSVGRDAMRDAPPNAVLVFALASASAPSPPCRAPESFHLHLWTASSARTPARAARLRCGAD
ncbi:MAG: hypothetical protein AB8I08_10150 [Sandaracinaceae bacterium]